MTKREQKVWDAIEAALNGIGDIDIRAGLAWIDDAEMRKVAQAAIAAIEAADEIERLTAALIRAGHHINELCDRHGDQFPAYIREAIGDEQEVARSFLDPKETRRIRATGRPDHDQCRRSERPRRCRD